MPTISAAPILTVFQPTPNLQVNFDQPFQITGQVTDRLTPEPISIDSVTVQVDDGPLIAATRKIIPSKTLTEVTFHATAQISSGNDPHTVTVVATNDEGLKATKTVIVFATTPFQVDAPALLVDLLFLVNIDPNNQQLLSLIGAIQRRLVSLSASLASVNKILIGPNVTVQPFNAHYLMRLGLWIEDPSFPVVPPSGDSLLPTLSDAAAAAAFAATPILAFATTPDSAPAFALFIPAATLQHLVDAMFLDLKAKAAERGFAIDAPIVVQTISPTTVNTNISGSILHGTVPASFTISETVGLQAVSDSQLQQMVPAVLSTNSTSSTGSILEWLVADFLPYLGAVLSEILLADVSYKVSVGASQQSGVAGSFLDSIPARVPFGDKAITLGPLTFPPFPTLNLYWFSFGATPAGLVGNGQAEFEARTEPLVKVSVVGPILLLGFRIRSLNLRIQKWDLF